LHIRCRKPTLHWQHTHAVHAGELRDGVKLQQGSVVVCALTHNARKENRRLETAALATAQREIDRIQPRIHRPWEIVCLMCASARYTLGARAINVLSMGGLSSVWSYAGLKKTGMRISLRREVWSKEYQRWGRRCIHSRLMSVWDFLLICFVN